LVKKMVADVPGRNARSMETSKRKDYMGLEMGMAGMLVRW
jgi:hypothetical protein